VQELEQLAKQIESFTNPHCMVPKNYLKQWVSTLQQFIDKDKPKEIKKMTRYPTHLYSNQQQS
jgi:hypothetical protein